MMLTREERAVLEFERAWWKQPGPKDQAIEFALGLTAAAYYEVLAALVTDQRAITFDPMTTLRVRGLMWAVAAPAEAVV